MRGLSRRRFGATLGAVLLGGALAGCGSDVSTGDKGYVEGDGIVKEIAAAKRKAAPDISGTTLQGQKVSLHSLAAGKPAVVNVWASWCPPCRAESPDLKAAHKQLGSGVAFLGVNVRDPGGKDNPLAFERSFAIDYPSIYDPEGRSLLGLPGGITLYSIPGTLVIDSRGRIAATVLGQMPSTRTLVQLVQDAET